MIAVIAKNKVKEYCIEKFLEITKELIGKSKLEIGCIEYNLYQDKNNLTIFTFIEKWDSDEALKKHMSSEHFLKIAPQLNNLLEGELDISVLNTVGQNTVSSNIFKRKSIRNFTDKQVEKIKIDNILKAAMQSPSAHNRQPWEFIVVTDKKALMDIALMSPYAKPLETATTAIIVCANLKTTEYVKDWIAQDLASCTENILLQIADEGLGGVWLGFYPDENRVKSVQEYYKTPEYILPFSVIALGYADSKIDVKMRYNEEKVHYDKY